jgi:hypothetical protein
MGLGAAVMCNCDQDGKTTSPPFPREWIEVDEEGYLTLTEDHASSANVAKLCVWEQSCCDHQDMDYVSESIANWSWYRLFQAALGEIGLDSFIVPSAELPNTNDGTMQPPSCRQALLELDYFMSWGVIGKKTVLVDSSTDESLYEYVPSYGGIFIWSKDHGINVGLNTSHFFAVDSRTGAVVFCARRFRQFNKDGSRITDRGGAIVWEDLETHVCCNSGIAIPGEQIPWDDGSRQGPDGRFRHEYPVELHVEQRLRMVDDFDEIVQALRIVFSAAVKTGNPVRWI